MGHSWWNLLPSFNFALSGKHGDLQWHAIDLSSVCFYIGFYFDPFPVKPLCVLTADILLCSYQPAPAQYVVYIRFYYSGEARAAGSGSYAAAVCTYIVTACYLAYQLSVSL